MSQLGGTDGPLVPGKAEPVGNLQRCQVDHKHARRTGTHRQDEQWGVYAHGQLDTGTARCAEGRRPETDPSAGRRMAAVRSRAFGVLCNATAAAAGIQRGLKALELVEKVHNGGEESLGVHIGDGGHFEVNIEVKLPSEVGVGLAVAEDAEVENLLAAAEEPIPILATVGAQVPDTEVA